MIFPSSRCRPTGTRIDRVLFIAVCDAHCTIALGDTPSNARRALSDKCREVRRAAYTGT